MGKGIHKDLLVQLQEAHDQGTCVFARSQSETRRLRNAALRGELICPAPRLYALPSLWNELSHGEREMHRLRGLSQLHPTWVFASYSAAVVHGLSVSYKLLDSIHVACERRSRSRSRDGITRHTVDNDMSVTVQGIRVTSLARTVFDAVNSCAFPEGLAIADSALRVSGMPREQLMEQVAVFGEPHRALETIALASGLAESGGESIARATMIQNGFAPPVLQKKVQDIVDKNEEFRVDFYWHLAEGDVIGELDGHEKYQNPSMTQGRDVVEVLADERLRESHLSGTNARVMRFSFADVRNVRKFCQLLTAFNIPCGYPVPVVARA